MMHNKISQYVKKNLNLFLNAEILKDLQWSTFGVASASGIMFVVHIISGRVLGPEQYGVASFIFFAANTLRIFCTNGSEMTLAKDLSRANIKDKHNYISSTFFVMICSLFFYGVTLFFLKPLFFRVNPTYFNIAVIVYALIVAFGFKFFFEAIARGFLFFQKQAILRLIETIFVLVSIFLFLVFLSKKTYLFFTISIILGSVFVIGYYGFSFFPYIKFKYFNFKIALKIYKSGLLFAFNSLTASFILLTDRFVVSHFLGQEVLGIYSAYALVSVTVAGLVTTIVSNVLFVRVAMHNDVAGVVKKVDKIFVRGLLPAFFGLFLLSSVAILFFGEQYGFNISYIALFSLYGGLTIVGSLYSPIITTHSNRVYGYTLSLFIFRVILLALYYITIIHYGKVSIVAVISGLIADYILSLLMIRGVIRKFIEKS